MLIISVVINTNIMVNSKKYRENSLKLKLNYLLSYLLVKKFYSKNEVTNKILLFFHLFSHIDFICDFKKNLIF
jgi:hypothetical protein